MCCTRMLFHVCKQRTHARTHACTRACDQACSYSVWLSDMYHFCPLSVFCLVLTVGVQGKGLQADGCGRAYVAARRQCRSSSTTAHLRCATTCKRHVLVLGVRVLQCRGYSDFRAVHHTESLCARVVWCSVRPLRRLALVQCVRPLRRLALVQCVRPVRRLALVQCVRPLRRLALVVAGVCSGTGTVQVSPAPPTSCSKIGNPAVLH